MIISDNQDGEQCEVGTWVGHRVHRILAWGHPYLLEGGDCDDCGMFVTIIVPLRKHKIDEMAGKRRGVDLCQPEGNSGRNKSNQVEIPLILIRRSILKFSRGGVPVCFPAFGPWPLGSQHGFARTSTWQQDGEISTDKVFFLKRVIL